MLNAFLTSLSIPLINANPAINPPSPFLLLLLDNVKGKTRYGERDSVRPKAGFELHKTAFCWYLVTDPHYVNISTDHGLILDVDVRDNGQLWFIISVPVPIQLDESTPSWLNCSLPCILPSFLL